MGWLKILRCGWCGCFCDNEGRKFEPTKQLVAANESVGFDDAKGECCDCRAQATLDEVVNEAIHSSRLAEIRGKVNKKTSTGHF